MMRMRSCALLLAELPLMGAGLIDFQMIPFLAYPGFAQISLPSDGTPMNDSQQCRLFGFSGSWKPL